MDEDYYGILGLTGQVTTDQIKKAYRRLALKYHPDKNLTKDTTEQFKVIERAYRILMDPEKRALHDAKSKNRTRKGKVSKSYKSRFARNAGSTGGSGDAKGAGRAKSSGGARGAERAKGSGGARGAERAKGSGGVRSTKSAKSAEGGNRAGSASDPFNSYEPGQSSGSDDIGEDPPFVYEVPVALENIANGCVMSIQISDQIVQPDGKTIKHRWDLSFPVHPGCEAGKVIRFRRKDAPGEIKPTVDILFVIRDQPHHLFTRDGSNIRYTAKITDQEAVPGSVIEIPTLTNGKTSITLPANFTMNIVATIHEEGLPLPGNPSVKGDLLVKFEIMTLRKRKNLNRSFPTAKNQKNESDINEY